LKDIAQSGNESSILSVHTYTAFVYTHLTDIVKYNALEEVTNPSLLKQLEKHHDE
jgi:hypothetical protein